MKPLRLFFLLLALVCFLLAGAGVVARYNLVSLGLACYVLAEVIPAYT